MNHIVLSRLSITGLVDEFTPLIVLSEIADAHGISYDPALLSNPLYIRNLLDKIYSTELVAVYPPYTCRQYQYIGRYINKNCSNWRVSSLMQAFDFIQHYMGPNYDLPAESDFPFGVATPNTPTSFNACILYKLCRHHRITLTRDTSLMTMAVAIRLLIQPLPLLRNVLQERLPLLDTNASIVNMLINSPQFEQIPLPQDVEHGPAPQNDEVVTYETIDAAQSVFANVGSLLRRVPPMTKSEAVVLAAMNYRIDLSNVRDPIREYNLLSNVPYIPSDLQLRNLIRRNRNYLRLDIFFNPSLPPTLYTDEILRNLAIREGYRESDLQATRPYELLQIAYLSNTFYAGYQEGIVNRETPISMENLDEVDNDVIICYGRKGAALTALRYGELAETFRHARNFINPLIRNATFEPLALRKLKLLASAPCPGESPEASQERQNLYNIMVETEILYDNNNSRARELNEVYRNANENQKREIQACIHCLFELSMYMRGWDGISRYPITQLQSDIRGRPQQHIDIAVTNAITRFEQKCALMGDLGNLIMSMPLLQYRGDFHASTEPNQGLTIRDRINIVKLGESHANIASCIRLSSNWLAATAYRYMQVIGVTPPFDIDSLATIH